VTIGFNTASSESLYRGIVRELSHRDNCNEFRTMQNHTTLIILMLARPHRDPPALPTPGKLLGVPPAQGPSGAP